MAAFGLFSLGSGLLEGELMPVFWGVMILAGLGILLLVRRRDWQQHWDDLERQKSPPPRRDDAGPPPP
jgi:low temperature requirement protein LtrA